MDNGPKTFWLNNLLTEVGLLKRGCRRTWRATWPIRGLGLWDLELRVQGLRFIGLRRRDLKLRASRCDFWLFRVSSVGISAGKDAESSLVAEVD